MKTLLFALIVSASHFASASAQEPIRLESLLLEMVDRTALTRLPAPAYKAEGASSYDRKSTVNDSKDGFYVETNGRDWGKGWFANRDMSGYIRTEVVDGRKEYVILEVDGPGALVRWWRPADNPGTMRVYLDGSTEPVIAADPDDFVGGTLLIGEPFSFITSKNEPNAAWRGRDLYLPIPYQEGCKITWENGVSYFQIGYRKYVPGTEVVTFTKDQLKDARDTIQRVAAKLTVDSAAATGTVQAKQNQILAPGSSVSIALEGPGAINRLSVQLSAGDYHQALRSTVLTLQFDDQQTAWLPIGALGGVGYSDEKNDTYFAKVNRETGTINSFYVMPFKSSAKATLTNNSEQHVTIQNFELTVDDYRWDNRSLHFHATWFELRNISTQNRSDLNFVTVKGAGRYVGTSITVFNTCTLTNNQTWWGEGDDKIYVDGETFPSFFGTGTEDYFGYAYCRPQRFYTPWISQPRGEGNKKWGYTNNNRYHMLDDIPFTSSVQFDMEIWHPFRKHMNYAAATFFYARPGSTHNIKPDIEAVRHHVALHRDDVMSLKEFKPEEPSGAK